MKPLDRQPELVLFDLDDTLCDYAGARTGRLRIAFGLAEEQSGERFTAPLDEIVQESIRMQPHGVDHFPSILTTYGIDDPAAIQHAITWFVDNRFHGLRLFPDAIQTLQTVRAALPNRRLGLITNGPASVQSAKIDLLGIRAYFDFCLISGIFGFWKPDREIFHEALVLGQAPASNAIMIGDSPEHDMAGAEATGITTIWIERFVRPWPEEIPAANYVVHDLSGIRQLLGASN